MVVSSRTPEGEPHYCAICKAIVINEPSQPFGDSICPRGGSLVLRLKEVLKRIGYTPDSFDVMTPFASDVACDSLDGVELVLQFEEEFDVKTTDDEAESILTVADAIQFILKKKSDLAGGDTSDE